METLNHKKVNLKLEEVREAFADYLQKKGVSFDMSRAEIIYGNHKDVTLHYAEPIK